MSATPDSSGAPSVRVVYIAGAKNCGSTLLDAILGNAPGARSLGEVGGFHRYRAGAACACQQAPCSVCPFVLSGLVEAGVAPEFPAVSQAPLKEKRAHWLIRGTAARHRYAEVADALFESAAATTDRNILIDSSKNATRAAALAFDSRFDIRVVHVVRDGRGYLRSRRSRAAVDGKKHVAAISMVSWLSKNLLIGTVLAPRLRPDRYLICRYEDLISDPGPTLERICAFAGLDATGLVEAATTGDGVPRLHLFEPARRTDYRMVRLDPSRLRTQRETRMRNTLFWALGGFLSSRWGYDREQSYLTQTVKRGQAEA